ISTSGANAEYLVRRDGNGNSVASVQSTGIVILPGPPVVLAGTYAVRDFGSNIINLYSTAGSGIPTSRPATERHATIFKRDRSTLSEIASKNYFPHLGQGLTSFTNGLDIFGWITRKSINVYPFIEDDRHLLIINSDLDVTGEVNL